MHSRMDIEPAAPDAVRPLHELHRREMSCQIVLDSWLGRGWAAPYLLRVDARVVGGVREGPKDTIMEFYGLPPDRGAALPLSRVFAAASGASRATLQRAGLMPCAQVLTGRIAPPPEPPEGR